MRIGSKYMDLDKYMPNLVSAGVMGDIHGEFHLIMDKVISYASNTAIFVAGDVGLGFYSPDHYDRIFTKLQRVLEKHGSLVVFIRGNHDNPDWYHNTEEVCPSLDLEYPNIIIADDYDVFRVLNHNILCIGGAISRDFYSSERVENVDWWRGEGVVLPDDTIRDWLMGCEVTDEFYQFTVLENSISTVVSHTCPLLAGPQGIGRLSDKDIEGDPYLPIKLMQERLLLNYLFRDLVQFNHIETWVFGHFHYSTRTELNDTKFIGLGVADLYELRY